MSGDVFAFLGGRPWLHPLPHLPGGGEEAASTPALKAALDSAGGHGTVALAVEEEFCRTAAM